MYISNTRLKFDKHRQRDLKTGACFICHKKGCRSDICPNSPKANKLEVENLIQEGYDSSH